MLMQNDLKTQLKKFREIQPDPDFTRRSKSVIVALNPHPVVTGFRVPFSLFWAGAMAVVLLVAVVIFPAKQQVSVSSLNPDRLAQELNTLDINVQLEQIKYYQTSNQEIALAINEIGDTRTHHLNSTLLESELENFETRTTTNPEIDELLDEVIF